MKSMNKVMFCLLGVLLLTTGLAFAQGEDFFVGTWQGSLSGEGLEIGPTEDFETGFSMDIVNLKVSGASSPDGSGYVYHLFSGWATVHYKTPKWIPKEDLPYSYTFKVETPVSGQMDGIIYYYVDPLDPLYTERIVLSLDYQKLRPVITSTWIMEELPTVVSSDTGEILGAMFEIIPEPTSLTFELTTIGDDAIKLNFEEEFIFSGITLSKVKVTGMLYKVNTEKDILGDTLQINELIKTDERTRKEIAIPNMGEVIVNVNSECKFQTDKLLEQIEGELFYKLRKLEPHQFEIHTPVSIIGPRGTQFLTNVEKDGTTTLTVLESSVEFSDLSKEKTVVVEKNQRSVVKPGGLPSEPISIDDKHIPRWWE